MEMDDRHEKSIKSILIILGLIVAIGTAGFYFLKGLSPWVAFYETMHLMLSHFYDTAGEHEPVSVQVLTLMIISGSLIIVVYLVKIFGDYLLGGQLKERMKKKKYEESN